MRALRKVGSAGVAVATMALVLVAAGGASSATAKTSSVARTPDASGASIPGSFGTLPPASGTPASTQGTVTTDLAPGAGVTWIFPIPQAVDNSTQNIEFEDYMWRPLYWTPKGINLTVDYADSLASQPVFTNNNKTVTIHMGSGWKWSDGTPVTSQDVAFDFWLYKAAATLSPANIPNFTPGLFPTDVTSISTPNPTTVVVHFNATHNAEFAFFNEIALLEPLPAQVWSKTSANGAIVPFDNLKSAEAIYNFLANSSAKIGPLGQSEDLKTYATNPLWQVVDGPFKLTAFDPATGGYSMATNTAYSGPVKAKIPGIQGVAFTSDTAEFDALLSGSLDVGALPHDFAAQIPRLESNGYYVWGYPEFEFGIVLYNFKDPTGDFDKIIGQLYIRQALAHLQNEAAVIKSRGVWDGLADQAYGPVPPTPVSPFAPKNAITNPYPFSISAAKQLLSSHGWHIQAGGTSTCQNPGTGPRQCGAGIPAGTPLTGTLYYANNSPIVGTMDEAWASDAKQVGFNMKLIPKTFDYLVTNFDDAADPANDKVWGMLNFGDFTQGLYPTLNGLFNTGASSNFGGFSNPELDQAIHDSVYSLNNQAIKHEVFLETELQPGLFQPNEIRLYAIKKTLAGPAFSWENLTQATYNPEYWYFVK